MRRCTMVLALLGAACSGEGEDDGAQTAAEASTAATDDGATAGDGDDGVGPGEGDAPTGAGTDEGDTTAGEPGTMSDTGATTGEGDSSGRPDDDDDSDSDGASESSGGVAFEILDLYDRQYIHYARVEKLDRVLNLYIEAQYMDGVQDDAPLPNDTILLREDGEPATFVHFREKVGQDDWYWGQFQPATPQYGSQPEQANCSCHSPWDERTVTIAKLREFKTTGVLIELVCDQPGNTSCAPKVYQ